MIASLISVLLSADFWKNFPAILALIKEILDFMKVRFAGDPGEFISKTAQTVSQMRAAVTPEAKQDALKSLADLINNSTS